MPSFVALRLLSALALIGSLLAISAAPVDAAEPPNQPAADQTPLTDQVIVVYEEGAARLPDVAIERRAGQGAKRARALDGNRDVIKLPQRASEVALQQIMNNLAAERGVASVEPDTIMVPLATPNDSSFPTQWDLTDPAVSGVYGINAPAAWDITTGSSDITVAVVDTGHLNHADLAGRIVGGYDFISDANIGNDGDGRDGSALDPGDWITSREARSGFFRGCPVGDSSWHGSHVSGTIGAATNNNTGIAGINWVSGILSIRALGKCGGYTSDITDGVRWAAGLNVSGVPSNPNPAKVVNLSLGGSGSCSSTWQSAINAVTSAGTVVVVAAGNSDSNAANYSPAGCNNVISVASTGKAGNRAYYSNYGSTVEIAAPGGDRIADNDDTILSTVSSGSTSPTGDSYAKYQGTSMAAPHVAGVASLMLSAEPGLSPAEVSQLMQDSARAFPSGSTCGGSTSCGAGIVDAAAAVAAATGSNPPPPPPPPPPPEGPGDFDKSSPSNGASGVNKRATLSWGSSSDATSYRVCIDTINNNACDGTWTTVSGTSARANLDRRVTYYWQVEAVNSSGSTAANSGTWWRFTTR